MRSNKIIPFSFILGILAFLSSCGNKKQPAPVTAFQLSSAMKGIIKIDTVKVTNIINQLNLNGEVAFDVEKVMRIFPNASGICQNAKISIGDYVEKDQVLCTLRSQDIAAMQNDLAGALNDSVNAKRVLDQTIDLFIYHLTTEADTVSARAGYQKAIANTNRARQIMAINSGSNGKDALVYIKAPQSGYVLEKKVTEGQLVRSDNSDYLFNIVNLKDVWIMGSVYESEISKVKLGMDAEIRAIAYPDKPYSGKVSKISDMLEPDSKVMKVRIVLDNPNNTLKPKMFCTVKLNWLGDEKKAMIPSAALVMDNSRNYVVVYKSDTDIKVKEVKVLKEINGKAFLDSGLEEGEKVVSGQQLILYNELKENKE